MHEGKVAFEYIKLKKGESLVIFNILLMQNQCSNTFIKKKGNRWDRTILLIDLRFSYIF